MTYSEVIEKNYHEIIPYKKKYTKRDANALFIHSLFNMRTTFTESQAKMIIVSTCIYHNENGRECAYSKYFNN